MNPKPGDTDQRVTFETDRLVTFGNPKVLKSRGVNVFSGVVHMLPSREYDRLRVALGWAPLGVNACPFAGTCRRVCLNTAGRGGIPMASYAAGPFRNNVEFGRFRRSHLYYTNPARFEQLLCRDIGRLAASAAAEGMTPAVRLNGTSDIDYAVSMPGVIEHAKAAGVRVYDYTKRPPGSPGGPVHLTYSVDVSHARVRQAEDYMRRGGTAAVVFATRKGAPLPATWRGFPVIDGDLTDARFLDPVGVVVGLRAKGHARGSAGFVYPDTAT